ncbi:hypothetical protein L9F63_005843, partial [Diploptera punctata]
CQAAFSRGFNRLSKCSSANASLTLRNFHFRDMRLTRFQPLSLEVKTSACCLDSYCLHIQKRNEMQINSMTLHIISLNTARIKSLH